MAKRTHIHRYVRKDLTRDKSKAPYIVYACDKPGCTHYLNLDLIDGKESQCYKCDNIFIIKINKIKAGDRLTRRPICDGCIKHRGKKAEVMSKLDAIDDLINSIIPK